MTEELRTLLRAEASTLPVPAAPAAAVLTRGRVLRRRRRLVIGSALVVMLAVAGTAFAVHPFDAATQTPPPATQRAVDTAPRELWAVAQGRTIHTSVGDDVTVPALVKSLYYTSAGVVVRAGDSASTDDASSHYWLIDEYGALHDLGLELGDRVPATDPALPYLAYADETAAGWDVVLVDVTTGGSTRHPLTGDFTWGGWVAPPVALSGDSVYVGLDAGVTVVDRTTGAVSTSSAFDQPTLPTVAGGRTVVGTGKHVQVVDVATGVTLLDLRGLRDSFASLSPDGRHLAVLPWRLCDVGSGDCSFHGPTTVVYDIETGTHTEVALDAFGGAGWSRRGDVVGVTVKRVRVCSADTGVCATTPVPPAPGDVRVAGASYEA